MGEPSGVLKHARGAAGLSVRALAQLAGVSASTVARIEAGQVDPSFSTLRRLLAAAGHEIHLTSEPVSEPKPRLADVDASVVVGSSGPSPNWTALRGFLDFLALHPEETRSAITPQPTRTGLRLADALVAAVAEKLADDADIPRPGWTHTAPKLHEEWASPGTPRMRDRQRANTPPQFLDRGLIIDQESLWRRPATVGA